VDELIAVLDPDASGEVDARKGLIVRGAHRVARNLVRFWARPGLVLVSQPSDDGPAVLAFCERKLIGVIGLTIEDERITKVHVHVDESTLMPFRAG
jgi:RNA polymerase sigma-70 factor (ECF subfamily)